MSSKLTNVRPSSAVSPCAGCERCSSSPFSSGSSPPSSYKSISPTPPMFLNKPTQALTFTTASFAATKFGSTKLKSNSKRNNGQRMSPTEFSNYIKQRAMAQQVCRALSCFLFRRKNYRICFQLLFIDNVNLIIAQIASGAWTSARQRQ